MSDAFGRLARIHRCPSCGRALEVTEPALPGPDGVIQEVTRDAIARLTLELDDAPESCFRFFRTVFKSQPLISSAKELAADLCMNRSTLDFRFIRAGLPAPAHYLRSWRLALTGALVADASLPLAHVATAMCYAHRSVWGRMVRREFGLSLTGFRAEFAGRVLYERFFANMIVNHRAVLLNLAVTEPERRAATRPLCRAALASVDGAR